MKVFELLTQHKLSSEMILLMEAPEIDNSKTGLKYPVWIGKVGGQHAARIKVGNRKIGNKTDRFLKDDCFVISIDEKQPKIKTPLSCKIPNEDRAHIIKWVLINKSALSELAQFYEKGIGDFQQIMSKIVPYNKK